MDFGCDFRYQGTVGESGVTQVVQELLSAAHVFDNVDSRARQKIYPELAKSSVVYLRKPYLDQPYEQPGDVVDCVPTEYQSALPLTWALVTRVFHGFLLGRVIVSKMEGPADIAPHVDGGRMAVEHARHHMCLNVEDADFQVGATVVKMLPGQLWEINNRRRHSVTNRSGLRLHLIVDVAGVQGLSTRNVTLANFKNGS